ncbi:MAG TPA: hypothetical protein VFD04_18235 [Actinomycetes bacterium]|nr:hypothetical protein [Actinomycetes bacterium]
MASRIRTRPIGLLVAGLLVAGLLATAPAVAAAPSGPKARFARAAAFDVSPSMRALAARAPAVRGRATLPAERGPAVRDHGYTGDAALQSAATVTAAAEIPAPSASFEGLSGADNQALLGGIPIPPDPVGDVSPTQYVEMVNLVWAVYSKTGTRLLGPLSLATIWAGFAVPDCEDISGDPIVLYDQIADRWILTQFTTNGPTYYNCVAVSTTPDATGSYFRYAFSTGLNFPDYPKYGVWPNAYFLATREFAPDDSFAGIGTYALERRKMLVGDPAARVVSFLTPPGSTPWITGDGWLPSDLDGNRQPPAGSPNYFVGTQDDDGPYRAPFDAINVFQFQVSWGASPTASFFQSAQIRVAEFDSAFPCTPAGSRNCIPQPDTKQKIDILSYRQRPTWRLAYRNFGTYESLVTNQSVEARKGIAGARWYELRRPGDHPFVYQQGTYAPDDGVNRWMGSIAQDRQGNMALGYSVSNGTTVFPGIRYTGRLAGDPLGQMPQGEGEIANGSGSQTDPFARWGDYTSMNLDPDNCTFWYVNEYYRTTSGRGWQTRIASIRLPGC